MVTADGRASYDPDGYIVSYLITWGDGNSNTTAMATHSYALAGTYAVSLLVRDNDGFTSSSSWQVVVGDRPPVASFSYRPAMPTVRDPLLFDASGSRDADGYITSYAWEFGDGATGSGSLANHTYTLAGDYYVTLTVTDDKGLRSSASQAIKVAPLILTGTPLVDLVGRKAWPSDHNLVFSPSGTQVTLNAWLSNLGSTTTFAAVRFTMQDGSGNTVATLDTVVLKIPSGQTMDVSVQWSVPGPGRYTGTAVVLYDGDGNGSLDRSGSATKTFDIKVA